MKRCQVLLGRVGGLGERRVMDVGLLPEGT